MEPFPDYRSVIERIEREGRSYRILDRTPFGQPIIDITVGGIEQPAVLVMAGAHATEQAGVTAAIEVANSLETDHEVHVVPVRDPIGMNGIAYPLSQLLDRKVEIGSFDDFDSILRENGRITYDEDGLLLATLGDFGFGSLRPMEDESTQLQVLKRLKSFQHEDPDVLEPYRGRRIFVPAGQADIPGSGTFSRAYTLVIGPDGRMLHLNRFFDTDWAPPEVDATRTVMEEIEPGLSFDLHETQLIDDRFYFGVNRHGRSDERERELAAAIRTATDRAGARFATDADLARVYNITIPSPKETPSSSPEHEINIGEGSYLRPDPSAGSEGLNAGHITARRYGPSIGTETGMWGSFEHRVEVLTAVVESGVRRFERFFSIDSP